MWDYKSSGMMIWYGMVWYGTYSPLRRRKIDLFLSMVKKEKKILRLKRV